MGSTGPDLIVRPAHPGDLPAVREILGRSWHAAHAGLIPGPRLLALHERWHDLDPLREQLAAPRTSFLVGLDPSAGIVAHGYATAENHPVLFVVRLYVEPGWERRGFGQALMAELVARHPGTRTDRLFVVDGNAPALAFYERLGFRVAGRADGEGVASLRLERARP